MNEKQTDFFFFSLPFPALFRTLLRPFRSEYHMVIPPLDYPIICSGGKTSRAMCCALWRTASGLRATFPPIDGLESRINVIHNTHTDSYLHQWTSTKIHFMEYGRRIPEDLGFGIAEGRGKYRIGSKLRRISLAYGYTTV